MHAACSIYRAAVFAMFTHEDLLGLTVPHGFLPSSHCSVTSGEIILCLTGLALLVTLTPKDVKIFPNWVFFTAASGRGF